MVTNSFGNRNFMQPMGRLSMHSKCLDFIFLFKFWLVGGGGGRGIFSYFPLFPKCSHQVPNGFHQVPNGFPRFLMCSPRVLPIAPRFNPIYWMHVQGNSLFFQPQGAHLTSLV